MSHLQTLTQGGARLWLALMRGGVQCAYCCYVLLNGMVTGHLQPLVLQHWSISQQQQQQQLLLHGHSHTIPALPVPAQPTPRWL